MPAGRPFSAVPTGTSCDVLHHDPVVLTRPARDRAPWPPAERDSDEPGSRPNTCDPSRAGRPGVVGIAVVAFRLAWRPRLRLRRRCSRGGRRLCGIGGCGRCRLGPIAGRCRSLGAGVLRVRPVRWPQEEIQQTGRLRVAAAAQVDAEFAHQVGSPGYALRCKPPRSATAPRKPADLPGRLLHRGRPGRRSPGDSPDQTGSVNVTTAACLTPTASALVNFWRSLSNLTINVAGRRGLPAARVLGGVAGRADAAGSRSTVK